MTFAELERARLRGLGRGQSIRDRALAPPCASHGDTARHTALAEPPPSGPSGVAITVFGDIR